MSNDESSEDSASDSNDEITNQPISREESDDEDSSLPVFLWKPKSHGLGDLGQWEAHTRVNTFDFIQFGI